MSDERRQYADAALAHPDLIEEDVFFFPGPTLGLGWYSMCGNLTPEDHAAQLAGMRQPMREAFEANIRDEWATDGTWEDAQVDSTCPENLDAEPFHAMVWSPSDVHDGEHLPAMLYFPGSGLFFGGIAESCMGIVIPIIQRIHMRMVVIVADYRLPPTHKCPQAIDDCHAAYLWMLEHADELHIDADRIVVAGGSTGGQMALSLGFRLKRHEYHGHMPRGIVALVPVMDDVNNGGSNIWGTPDGMQACGWDPDSNRATFKMWLGDDFGDPSLAPEVVPGRATASDLVGYPPVWFPACPELDTPRDATIRFAQRALEASIFCDLHMWGGCGHNMPMAQNSDLGKRIYQDICGAIHDALTHDLRKR